MLTTFRFGYSGLFCLGLLDIDRHYLCSTTSIDAIQSADEISDKGLYHASVATIIRMPFVLFYFHPNPDYLYRHCHVSLWSTVEAGIGIIAGSLPALRKFVKRWITFDSSARQYSPPRQYGGSHGLGITSHIGTADRVKGYGISRDVENDGKDHWEGLDDGSSRKGIMVTVDVEMHTLENNAEPIGSRVSDETYARPA
ncbi:integral membrane protein PTH11 [Fusarium phyllophilum]|uniref:Integral membrane protein PTH11 n=1 Tax=Fusarium phyllophilum TaxID=47803 RepID=A0A8H5K8H9_9HYPO|nr:integral membrane protein PTH11 [Fusarium phyllophilum]